MHYWEALVQGLVFWQDPLRRANTSHLSLSSSVTQQHGIDISANLREDNHDVMTTISQKVHVCLSGSISTRLQFAACKDFCPGIHRRHGSPKIEISRRWDWNDNNRYSHNMITNQWTDGVKCMCLYVFRSPLLDARRKCDMLYLWYFGGISFSMKIDWKLPFSCRA